MLKADLHTHTTCSDGSLTPQQLVLEAKQKGLQGLSITDHDTVAAYRELFPFAEAEGIMLLSGVEFSTWHANSSIHVLGYAFSLESPSIQDLCLRHIARRQMRNKMILDKLYQRHRMRIEESELGTGGSVGRPHIAKAMVDKGYVRSIQEAFKVHLGEECCCFEPGEPFSTEETIDCIHAAGGLAVIAHPHLINAPNVVSSLLQLPFDGIEVYYARFNRDQVQRWLKIAEKKQWLVTGGSDFHGSSKPNNPLGSSFAPEETFHHLRALFLRNQMVSTP